jgi:flavin-dependent dehydrogenase
VVRARDDFDVLVVGAGPGGSTAGRTLARLGMRVGIIERQPFPRYHIGESLTGTCGQHLRAVGLADQMCARRFPVKFGVRVVGRDARNDFFVAAAPEPTWQVRREEFDQMLLEHALQAGAEHLAGQARDVIREDGRVIGVRLETLPGDTLDLRARFVVDASGLGTWLSARRVAGARVRDDYSDQVAVFSQVEGAARDPGLLRGNTLIFYNRVHHWAWFIPLDDDVVSVGIVVQRQTYKEVGQRFKYEDVSIPAGVLRWGIGHINPDLRERCDGRPVAPVVHCIRDYSYQVSPFAGPGWVCVGDSHRFIDPIFSFGVSIAIHEGEMAAAAIARVLEGADEEAQLREYQRRCALGQDAVADVIRYFWRYPAFFGVQSRGRYRDDIMRLFAGACYDEEPIPGLVMMRESLARAGGGRSDASQRDQIDSTSST